MALPTVKRPFVWVESNDSFLQRQRYSQKRPFDLVLPYSLKRAQVLRRGVYGAGVDPISVIPSGLVYSDPTGSGLDHSTRLEQAKAIAYSRLLDKISDRATWGENLIELPGTYLLLRKRVLDLVNTVKLIKRRDPKAFAQFWKSGVKGKDYSLTAGPRNLAGMVLEFNFAVKPLMNDIFQTVDLLQNPLKAVRVRGRGKVDVMVNYNPTPSSGGRWVGERGVVRASYGVLMKIGNPNLWLANSLGLINPAQVLWQVLPGSFLIDWLLPIEQFLGQATDFLGLEVLSSYTTTTINTVRTEGQYPGFYKGQICPFSRCDMERVSGVSLPSLRLRPLKVPGKTRALNATSLAIQAFMKEGGVGLSRLPR